eukprot:10734622-Alexandrium_andersonii.AAC.1
MASPPAAAPTMLSVQIHPGGSFHFHQPGSEVAMAPGVTAGGPQLAGGSGNPHVHRNKDGVLSWGYARDPS